MKRLMLVLAAFVAVVAVASALAYPGASGQTRPVGYATISGDFASPQWRALNSLLQALPGRAAIQAQLGLRGIDIARDVQPAIGDRVDVALLDVSTRKARYVASTTPRDPAKLDALLKRLKIGPERQRTVDGVRVVASDPQGLALGPVQIPNGTFAGLPADALVRAQVAGDALTTSQVPGFGKLESVGAAARATASGLRVDSVIASSEGGEYKPFKATLLAAVPADAVLAASFKGLDEVIGEVAKQTTVRKQLAPLEKLLGVKLTDLAPLFANEGVLYARKGVPLPELTLVLAAPDKSKALALADRLAQGIVGLQPRGKGGIETTTVGGVEAKRVSLGAISLLYAWVDGKLVITDSTEGISNLSATGPKLVDSAGFKLAATEAGMPDETDGLVYVDLKGGRALIETATGLLNRPLDRNAKLGLGAVKSALVYATTKGEIVNATVWARVK